MDKHYVIAGVVVIVALLLSAGFFAYLAIITQQQNGALANQNTALTVGMQYLNASQGLALQSALSSENASNLQTQLQTANNVIAYQSSTITSFYNQQENELNNLQASLDAKALASSPTPCPSVHYVNVGDSGHGSDSVDTTHWLPITVSGLQNTRNDQSKCIAYLQNQNSVALSNCYIQIDVTNSGDATGNLACGVYTFNLPNIGADQSATQTLPLNYLTLCTTHYSVQAFGSP